MIIECPRCKKKHDFDETNLAKGAVKVQCMACENIWVVKERSRILTNFCSKLSKENNQKHIGKSLYI